MKNDINLYKDLSMKYKEYTDKLSDGDDYAEGHTYSVIYDRLFYRYKNKKINFLEIGTNFGGKRRSFYELAMERRPDVNKGSISEVQSTSKVPILVDTSLKVD